MRLAIKARRFRGLVYKYKPWKEGYIGTLAYLWHREEKSLLADAQREL